MNAAFPLCELLFLKFRGSHLIKIIVTPPTALHGAEGIMIFKKKTKEVPLSNMIFDGEEVLLDRLKSQELVQYASKNDLLLRSNLKIILVCPMPIKNHHNKKRLLQKDHSFSII